MNLKDKNSKTGEPLLYIHEDLFPLDYTNNKLPTFLYELMKVISGKIKNKNSARVPGLSNADVYSELEEKYGTFPKNCVDPLESIKKIASDFTTGVPMWRSPYLQYNVGAPVNIASAAIYSLALDMNIYNINSGLAGNALIAEKAVVRILASFADIDPQKSFGLFTFGGTATNLYALKISTRRVFPKSGVEGIPNSVTFLLTEDAHFSHSVAIDWMGVGTENATVIKANSDRTSNIKDAEHKMRLILEEGKILSAIMLNGGTTYDHAVDDIVAFVGLRDRLVQEYALPYSPHIHVDAVIGWAWLVFKDYDFKKNELDIPVETLEKIEIQYGRVRGIKYADSWGVDFHKGVGACPLPCSVVMMNDRKNFMQLSKTNNPSTIAHQLSQEFSFDSPADYTLETSRPGGAPLAALAALHTLGQQGYQSYLAHLVSMSLLTKKLIKECNADIAVCNPQSLGYVTMIRIYPLEFAHDTRKINELSSNDEDSAEFTHQVNKYMKAFFAWDYENRIKLNHGVEYSYSSTYVETPLGIKIPAIKFYPTSLHINKDYIHEAVKILVAQKNKFDSLVWKKKN